jgi:4-hydroxybenzoate polyprenyltransferase
VDPPPWIGRAGLVALAVGVGLAARVDAVVAGATALAAALAVAYSHPRLAWKARPWLGPAVNVVGYGLLSPFVGWWVVGTAVDVRTLAAWAGGGVAVLGCVYVAQAFQADEDRARGYRTRVATHGPEATVDAARLAFAAAFGLLLGLAAAGWLPRLLLLAAPLAVGLDRRLARWAAGPVDVDGAVDVGRRLLRAALACVLLALVDHAVAGLLGGPVAGLATAAGWPGDAPRVPAWAERSATRRVPR